MQVGAASPSPALGSIAAATSDEVSEVIAAANLHNDAGRHAQALAIIDDALSRRPDEGELLSAKGSTLYEWGRSREALELFRRAERVAPDDPGLPLKLGWTYFTCGRFDEAVLYMRKATDIDRQSAKAHFGLGAALRSKGVTDEATRSFETAHAIAPDDYDTLIQLAGCKLDAGEMSEAEALYRRAAAIHPELPEVWTNLGAAFFKHERLAEGFEAFERADRLEAEGEDVDNFVNLAVAHSDEGRLERALALYEENLPRRPSSRGHFGYAGVLLRAGRMREGWSHYEFRWTAEPYRSLRARSHKPMWSGQDLRGRTILLFPEQGFGDSIQFLRYAPMLKSLGATVLFRAVPGLEALARSFRGVDGVLETGDPLPEFDFYIHLMSLPRVFATDVDTIPTEVPYLRAEPEKRQRWVEWLGQNRSFNVGLVWAGNPRHHRDSYRSIRLSALAKLAQIDGVRLISLQKGPGAAEVGSASEDFRILDPTSELHDFSDTAALIDALDLVITVDTAVLHLAGALGKPVWGLLTTPPDFRWMDLRDDSLWYPTMRLYRQQRRNDWDEVIVRVEEALREAVACGNCSQVHDGTIRSAEAAPAIRVIEDAAAPGVRQGFYGIAETRHGLLSYRPDDTPVGKSLDWYGEFLEPHLALLAQVLRPGFTVLEAGAGIGAHSTTLASLLGADGHLMVYEDDALQRRVLAQNLSVSDANNVTIMRRRLAGPRDSRSEGAATAVDGANGENANTVVSETLDDLRLDTLHLLKSNETGAAIALIEGASDTLWRLRPLLLLAVPEEATLAELAERLRAFGYRCARLDTPYFNQQNLNRRDNDIFDGRKALALFAVPEESGLGLAFQGCVELL